MTPKDRRPLLKGMLCRLRAGVVASVALGALALGGCQVSEVYTAAAHTAPIPADVESKIDRLNMTEGSPILLRIFKQENALEVWKENRQGKFELLKQYEICAWSGELGPKIKEGDRQAPEGFYHVTPGLMNPRSSYHLAFNLGFPNAYDRAHGRTGTHLMVHGDCSSRGCYAMEDAAIQEIYALAREAFEGGQRAFQVQAFPFRMTAENMAKHAGSPHMPFWEMLKEGSDHFEVTRQVPKVDVCGRAYVFNAAAPEGSAFDPKAECPAYTVDPGVEALVAAKEEADRNKAEILIAQAEERREREERWAEREKAIAALFNQNRDTADASGEPGAAPDGSATPEAAAPVLVAGVPVPRPSPRGAGTAAPAAAPASGGGLRLPNPFRRDPAPAPAAVVAVAPPAEASAPAAGGSVASTAGDLALASSSPQGVPQSPVTGEPVAEPTALGFQAEDEGFFADVAKGSRGLFRRAGSLFE